MRIDDRQRIIYDTICKSRKLILREVRADSCVLSTSIAIRAAAHFDIRMEPVHVSCMIFNPWVAKQFDRLGRWPDQDTLESWVRSPKGWSVGLGVNMDGTWPELGHLVAVGEQTFLDMSIDQASRPQKHMNLEPFWLRLPADWLRRFLTREKNINMPFAGSFLSYTKIPGEKYLESRDWNEKARSEHIVQWIIKNVNLKLVKEGL